MERCLKPKRLLVFLILFNFIHLFHNRSPNFGGPYMTQYSGERVNLYVYRSVFFLPKLVCVHSESANILLRVDEDDVQLGRVQAEQRHVRAQADRHAQRRHLDLNTGGS